MNQVKFAEEFTQLLSRWIKPVKNEDGTTAPRLTNQEIARTVQSVQQVFLGVNLQMPDHASMKTPATGIAVCTPSAPTIQKTSPDRYFARYRSLDTLIPDDKDVTIKLEDLASKSQEHMDVDEYTGNETTIEDKKFISRSSPAIHLTKIAKSNTFVCDEEKTKDNFKQITNDTFIENETSFDELQKIIKKIDELRDCAINIVSKIDEVKMDVCPQSMKPIRRLSSIGGHSGTFRSSTLIRPMPPSKLRRSTSGIPGTPTSSKLNSTLKVEKIANSSRRATVDTTPTIRCPKNSPINRSVSTATMIMKKSPCTTKNPKYAHVKSTIPKSTTTKRKAQP